MGNGDKPYALYYPHTGEGWSGISVEPYKIEEKTLYEQHVKPSFKGVLRHTLAASQADIKFHLRYFEIEPGGYTTFERHNHAHVVIGKRGVGIAIAGEEIYTLREDDILIIKGGAPHQLLNREGEPFGFYCIVDADRDPPKPVTPIELEELCKKNPKIHEYQRLLR
ncbi:MAG: cupin domain-containing protein [Candidatus Bathyarchaeia archaeon]